jgi:SlyX protein
MTEPGRLDALETKCAFLESAVQELSDVLYRQQQALDRLLTVQQELLRRLAEVGPAAAAPPEAAERPPHY